jgi:hypothetical protein
MKKCCYENCTRLVNVGSKHDDCQPCRTRYRYWQKKSAAHRLERRRKLSLSNETMTQFVDAPRLKKYVRKEHNKEVRNHARLN